MPDLYVYKPVFEKTSARITSGWVPDPAGLQLMRYAQSTLFTVRMEAVCKLAAQDADSALAEAKRAGYIAPVVGPRCPLVTKYPQ